MPSALHIFRAGRHQSMGGSVLEFSEADLAATARAYDPALHEAPLTIGHPETNAPAYGWVRSLTATGADLQADPHQIDPAFQEMVGAGRFKKISASFYLPDAKANPVPGVYYLRHVGFLGAQPPAVKGLRDAAFADGDDDHLTIEFGEADDRLQVDLWTSLREWLIAQFGLEKADQAISRYTVDALRELALRDDTEDATAADPSPAGFAEPSERSPTMPDTQTAADAAALEAQRAEFAEREAAFAEQQAALAARETEIAARETALREQEEAARRRELLAFADGLADAGQLLPRDVAWAAEFMAQLSTEQAVSFGEGDERGTQSMLDSFKAFLGQLPKQVHFGEHAPASGDDGNRATPSNKEIAERARAYHDRLQQAGRTISYAEAVDAVAANLDRE